MNKKFLIGGISILLILSVCLYFYISDNNTERVIITNEKTNQVINTNALTMMYETEAGSGEYQVSSDTTWPQEGYEFNETLSKCENGGTLSWNSETNRVVMQTSGSDKCYVYFDAVYTAAMMITDLFNQGSEVLTNLDPDRNIRYVGENPNNYVLFNDELWRIIGVFNNKLKIIRDNYILAVVEDSGKIVGEKVTYNNTYSGTYFYWNYNGTNNWETSSLNNYLNGTYYNSIKQNSRNLIDKETWYLGSFDEFPTTASEFYQIERNTNVYDGNPLTTSTYVGLIYPSDLIYSMENWNEDYYNSWLRQSYWLISASSTNFNKVVAYFGFTSHFEMWTVNDIDSTFLRDSGTEVYPTLYLKSTTNIISGDGSEENPYILD